MIPSRRWRSFLLRIVLPAVLAGVLFVLAIFLILIPGDGTAAHGRQEADDPGADQGGRQHPRRVLQRGDGGTHDAGNRPRPKPRPGSSCSDTGTTARTTSGSPTCIPTMVMHPYLPGVGRPGPLDLRGPTGQEDVRRVRRRRARERLRFRRLLLAVEGQPGPHRPETLLRGGVQTLAMGHRHRDLRRGRQAGHRPSPAQPVATSPWPS